MWCCVIVRNHLFKEWFIMLTQIPFREQVIYPNSCTSCKNMWKTLSRKWWKVCVQLWGYQGVGHVYFPQYKVLESGVKALQRLDARVKVTSLMGGLWTTELEGGCRGWPPFILPPLNYRRSSFCLPGSVISRYRTQEGRKYFKSLQ